MLEIKLPLADWLGSHYSPRNMFLNGLCDSQLEVVGPKAVDFCHDKRLPQDFL